MNYMNKNGTANNEAAGKVNFHEKRVKIFYSINFNEVIIKIAISE